MHAVSPVSATVLTVNVFEQDPGLLAGLDAEARANAVRVGEAERITFAPGKAVFEPSDGFGLLVLDGFLCRVAEVTDRSSVEVLGRGDVLRPWEDGRAEAPVPVTSFHRVLSPASMAVLDREFAEAVAPWPRVAEAISGRFLERARWLALELALTRVRRIEDRLHILFWHLADRWGRVERTGTVVCPIPLTHDLLAGMVGAQRPTVSTAITQLAVQGRVTRDRDGWALHGAPPRTPDIEGRTLSDAFRLRTTD